MDKEPIAGAAAAASTTTTGATKATGSSIATALATEVDGEVSLSLTGTTASTPEATCSAEASGTTVATVSTVATIDLVIGHCGIGVGCTGPVGKDPETSTASLSCAAAAAVAAAGSTAATRSADRMSGPTAAGRVHVHAATSAATAATAAGVARETIAGGGTLPEAVRVDSTLRVIAAETGVSIGPLASL